MHPELQEALEFHKSIVAEAGKALVGYETEKALANIVLMSEIPTTYDQDEQKQVNAGNLLLRGVPGIGKTFFGVIIAAISDARFARIQGRADLQPTEVVGFQMINPATGAFITEFGPLASAEVILLDEINRIPLKSQSAFLEGLQDRKITVGKTTYDLPTFSFAIATMNPVELGQGTFPLSEAATDRFAIMVNIGYLPPEEEQKLVNFDFKQVRLNKLMSKERIVQLRGAITREVFLHEKLGKYIRRLVGATRPYNVETDWLYKSPSDLVEQHVDLGASPRATICWGRLVKVWAVLARDGNHRSVGRLLSGHVRVDDVRQRIREHGLAAAARGPRPRHPLPGRVSGTCRDGGSEKRRAARDDDRRPLAPDLAVAGGVRFSVRRSRRRDSRALPPEFRARRVSRDDRQRLRLRAAGRVGGVAERV
ncbi:MAG: AAA family ATPase [Vicinamibacterales bacterium]|nr:AAA family ATPase [Vicinamibacterales bacterium]